MELDVVYNKSCQRMDELPDESIDCILTSPPYWGLRNYGEDVAEIWGGDEDCEHEWIGLNSCSQLLSLKTESISLIKISSKLNAFFNTKINTKTSCSFIEVRSETRSRQKFTESNSKEPTSSRKGNSAMSVDCSIAIKDPSDKIPFNFFWNNGQSDNETLPGSNRECSQFISQRNRVKMPSPNNISFSCPLLSNRLGWCDAISNKFRQFLILTNKTNLSCISNISIGYKQTYEIAEFRCVHFSKKLKFISHF